MLNQRFLTPTDQKCANSSTYWQFFHYRPPGIPREGSREYYARTRYIAIYVYIYMYIEILTLSIIIDIDRQHWKSCTAVATFEWHTVKICKHSHNRLIDNIGDYLYFKNQRMEASNLKLIHISSTWDCTTFHNFLPMFKKKKKIFKNWQVYDWRTKWLIMSGYMDLRRPRVYRRSNVGLVLLCVSMGHASNNTLYPLKSLMCHDGINSPNICFMNNEYLPSTISKFQEPSTSVYLAWYGGMH